MMNDVLVLDKIPKKTAKGGEYISKPRHFLDIKLSVQLRRLLILIDGNKSISELLGKGITGVDEESFDTLFEYGLIAFLGDETETDKLKKAVELHKSSIGHVEKSFTTTRYVLLDTLIDLSMKDFSVRPWINRFEAATSIDDLVRLVDEFAQSEEGQLYAEVTDELKQLAN